MLHHSILSRHDIRSRTQGKQDQGSHVTDETRAIIQGNASSKMHACLNLSCLIILIHLPAPPRDRGWFRLATPGPCGAMSLLHSAHSHGHLLIWWTMNNPSLSPSYFCYQSFL